MRRFSKRELEQLNILVPEHTVKYFSEQPEEIKRMIEKCRKDKNYGCLEQWQYIEYCMTHKDEKVVFT